MALNINWQGPQAHNLDVNSAMHGNREMLNQAGQGVGTFIKNYRKYRADQEMKGLIDEYQTGKGQRDQRMHEILVEIKQLQAENQQIRQQLESDGYNWR